MIPLRDANPTRRTPYFTWGLIAINVALFFLWQPLGSAAESQVPGLPPGVTQGVVFSYCHGAIPEELTSFEPLPDVDAACDGKSVAASLFTAMFLHGGLLHLGGNMLYLWIFGNNVEDRMGHVRFLLFYLIGGIAATYAHVATEPSSTIPLIGASGAIAAVLGAYIVLWPHARILTAIIFYFITVVQLPAALVLGFWFVLQFFQGALTLGAEAAGGVAWFAHIGGFVFGAGVAWLFYRRPERQRARWTPPAWEP